MRGRARDLRSRPRTVGNRKDGADLALPGLDRTRRRLVLRGRCVTQESVALQSVRRGSGRAQPGLARRAPAALRRCCRARSARWQAVSGAGAVRGAAAERPRRGSRTRRSDAGGASRASGELLARIAAEKPLVIWIDDLQWSDPESVGAAVGTGGARPAGALFLTLVSERGARADVMARIRRGEHDGRPVGAGPSTGAARAGRSRRRSRDLRARRRWARPSGSPRSSPSRRALRSSSASSRARSIRTASPSRPTAISARRRPWCVAPASCRCPRASCWKSSCLAGQYRRAADRATALGIGERGRPLVTLLEHGNSCASRASTTHRRSRPIHDRIREAVIDRLAGERQRHGTAGSPRRCGARLGRTRSCCSSTIAARNGTRWRARYAVEAARTRGPYARVRTRRRAVGGGAASQAGGPRTDGGSSHSARRPCRTPGGRRGGGRDVRGRRRCRSRTLPRTTRAGRRYSAEPLSTTCAAG